MNLSSCLKWLFPLIAILVPLACSKKGDSGSGTSTESQKVSAAQATAINNTNCTAIAPFYWEIGDASSILVSGATGDGSVTRTTTFGIASASKWMFGSYVIQKLNGSLDTTTQKFLKMSGGYTSFGNTSCLVSATVLACYNVGTNSTYTAANDGKFYYSGGHFQKWAVDNSMGALTKVSLASEYQSYLGSDIGLSFGSTQLAGGVQISAAGYVTFLRKIISGQLLMKNFLGANTICTLPGACAAAVASPIPEEFHYSYGHWVEDDPISGDGAYSSAGLFGFYPWIDATKTYYGVISRYEIPSGGNDIGAGWASILCGRLIRKAYMTGTAQ